MSTLHPPLKNSAEIMDFVSFIKKYFDYYEIDGFNLKILQHLNLWANRDKKFNNLTPGWHIDRGLLLWGNPGSGKDEVFRLLNQYLTYLRSPYHFDHRIVWEFSERFSKKDGGGYGCFSEEGKANRYYEELCLTDEATDYPTKEVAQHMGNKVLVGSEIIHLAHNSFKNNGIQAHFSTNVEEERLRIIYGERAYSRLKYMCNFIKITGKDRRKELSPVFLRNVNQPPPPPKPKELELKEHEDNKTSMDQHYYDFLADKTPSTNLALVYNILVSYGVAVATDDELRQLMEQHEKVYVAADPSLFKASATEKEKAKQVALWERSRVVAVQLFFQKMKDRGAKSIFGMREVEVILPGDKSLEGIQISEEKK